MFRNKRIDTLLSSPLFDLMGKPEGQPTSLPARNLLRGLMMELPSGQRVGRAMRLPVLDPADLDDLAPFGLRYRAPLWFYVLREAEVTAVGEHLGPVGGTIVAEVIAGLVLGDRQSCLRQDPGWRPTYGDDGTFAMIDLLRAPTWWRRSLSSRSSTGGSAPTGRALRRPAAAPGRGRR